MRRFYNYRDTVTQCKGNLDYVIDMGYTNWLAVSLYEKVLNYNSFLDKPDDLSGLEEKLVKHLLKDKK